MANTAFSAPYPTPGTFGQRLRWARLRYGHRQGSALARIIGRDPRSLYRWERDNFVPAHEVLHELADHLGVDIVWLQYGRGTPFGVAPTGVEAYLKSAEGKKAPPEVAESLRQLPYDRLGIPDPTREEVARARIALEMWLADAKTRRNVAHQGAA